ncbi:Uncharacterised protein [Leminorella grimontii]|nr:Uncharacterised protein [Leminorella grimontii]
MALCDGKYKEMYMSQLGKWLAFAAFVIVGGFSLSVQAGDPGPYRLAFVDISEPSYQDGQALAIELRKMDRFRKCRKSTVSYATERKTTTLST